jgi:hypothetical protein
VKVNKISLKQEGGQTTEQVEAQPQQQSVDPAVQQISDYISQAISQGQNAAEVVMSLVEQQVDQQTIGQALMMNGFEENDIMSLFEQMSQGQEEVSNEPGSPDDLNNNPQEISRNESLEAAAMSEEEMQDPEMEMGKSGIEIKPENEGKFTRWAQARGMSVQDAASKVMANTDEYPPAVVKMANFAKNAAGWKKQEGGGTDPVNSQVNSGTNKGNKFERGTRIIDQYAPKLNMKPDTSYMYQSDNGPQFYSSTKKNPATDKPYFEYTNGNNTSTNMSSDSTNMYMNRIKDLAGYQMGGVPQGKVGAVNNVSVGNKDMNWQSAPLYMNPMAFESNDNFSLGKAAAVIGGGYKEFLSGADENKDGVKDGFFRDGSKKAGIRDATKGNYYNYKVTQDANDTNKYVADNTDLFNASKNKGNLRTTEQYGKDVLDNSRFNYNTATNGYDGIQSSRPIDERIYNSDNNKNALAGKDYNYLKSMDKATKDMIMGTKDDPQGTTLGINDKGQASSYAPGADNPYEYNTYMGINKVGQKSMIPPGDNPGMFNTQPTTSMMNATPFSGPSAPTNTPQKSFKDWYATGDAVRNQSKSQSDLSSEYNAYLEQRKKYGGDLMQVGGEPMSKDEWMNANGRGLMGQESIDENDYQKYATSVKPPVAPVTPNPAAAVVTPTPPIATQTMSAPLPSFAPPTSFLGTPPNTPSTTAAPAAQTFEPPKVERTNNIEGGFNRFMDSPGMQGYTKLSNFAVQGADLVNDYFRDKSINQAKEDNFNKLGADYQYATAEDPFNKRGLWDINTGTAGSEGDRTTGLYMSKYGGENNIVNVDSNLLAKLIAAGADIEIL